ncbi:solute carrier family 22 member 18-like, partial [Seriola lalandi dorsalis]|uniref:solute carrier family 22 member 18-like n=1 Tax=Seriola lalandi dorsalis TaxID=1841481 RepID=UPI000C6FA6C3
LAKKLGFDTLWFGYLQTMVGIIQLLGGPMFGRFADLFGARVALSLACASSIVFFLLLAIADHPAMLFIHKIPTVFMHVLPASQMVVADLSEPEKRADALSKLGLCFGVGMIAGSTLGGHLNTRYG